MKREIQPFLLDDVDSNPDENFLEEKIMGTRRSTRLQKNTTKKNTK